MGLKCRILVVFLFSNLFTGSEEIVWLLVLVEGMASEAFENVGLQSMWLHQSFLQKPRVKFHVHIHIRVTYICNDKELKRIGCQ